MKWRRVLGVWIFVFAVGSTGCLKTRSQIKAEEQEGVPTKVTPVEGQGRYAIDEIKSELTRLNGRIEDMERAQSDRKNDNTGEKLGALEKRVIELEQAQVAMLEAIKKLEKKTPPADPARTYNDGLKHLEAKDHEKAIDSFTQYLNSKHEKFQQSAVFFRGEAHYALKEYKKAIVDFSQFPEKFQQSKRVPEALYKIGLSFDALGMKDDAKAFYQELIGKFPKSAEAKKAKAKLAGSAPAKAPKKGKK